MAWTSLATMSDKLDARRINEQRELSAIILSQVDTVDFDVRILVNQRGSHEQRTSHSLKRGPSHATCIGFVFGIAYVAQSLEIHGVVKTLNMTECTFEQILVCFNPMLSSHTCERTLLVVRVNNPEDIVGGNDR